MSKRSKELRSYGSFKPENKIKTSANGFIKIIIVFFLIYQFISFFLLTSFVVNTSAMEPGINNGYKIISAPVVSGAYINSFKIPGFRDPGRGDIFLIKPGNVKKIKWYFIILDPLIRFLTFQKISVLPYKDQSWNNQLSIKRVIGVPGDSIKMSEYKFLIKPKNATAYSLEEDLIEKDYQLKIPQKTLEVDSSFPFLGNMEEITLSKSQYFVANDNRSISYDSRLYGPIPRKNILGPVILSYWPDFSFK